MGRLWDACQEVDALIASRGLDPYKTKGQISLEAGFFLSFIMESDPDDEDKLQALRDACQAVLGERISA